tara:strand:- start:8372 stop:8662 length:291 start_codon:yes stop_codon:yes gene_type:complete
MVETEAFGSEEGRTTTSANSRAKSTATAEENGPDGTEQLCGKSTSIKEHSEPAPRPIEIGRRRPTNVGQESQNGAEAIVCGIAKEVFQVEERDCVG